MTSPAKRGVPPVAQSALRAATAARSIAPTELPATSVASIIDLLGVKIAANRNLSNAVMVHEYLARGLPRRALLCAMEPGGISETDLLPVFNISMRTLARIKAEPTRMLDLDRSSRLWQFAEVIVKAGEVLGGRSQAIDWLTKPAMALENRRPIELLTTPVGTKLVLDAIERMRFGVYQ